MESAGYGFKVLARGGTNGAYNFQIFEVVPLHFLDLVGITKNWDLLCNPFTISECYLQATHSSKRIQLPNIPSTNSQKLLNFLKMESPFYQTFPSPISPFQFSQRTYQIHVPSNFSTHILSSRSPKLLTAPVPVYISKESRAKEYSQLVLKPKLPFEERAARLEFVSLVPCASTETTQRHAAHFSSTLRSRSTQGRERIELDRSRSPQSAVGLHGFDLLGRCSPCSAVLAIADRKSP